MSSAAAPAAPAVHTLSEHQSKILLAQAGIPVTREKVAASPEQAVAAAAELGFPVAVKASGAGFAHKSELGLVELGLSDADQVLAACARLSQRAPGLAEFLVQEMVEGRREFIAGLVRDPQYGPAVMLGLGGIFAEALEDVVFRVAPLTLADGLDMLEQLKAQKLLGAFRGEPALDRQALAQLLVKLGDLGLANPQLAEIDLNPLKFPGGQPLAVDALVAVYG